MSGHVVTETAGGVLTLRFNRPEKKNALLVGMYGDAADILKAAAADPTVRVIVITGTADSFTAGNDLKDFLENPPLNADAPVFRFMHGLANMQKPVIAAVNGLAIGIGTTLLMHCDLAYAVAGAKFQMPFVNIAIVPEFASSLLLPRLVGHVRAAELLLLGDAFTAEKAFNLGLINAVVAPEQLMPTVMQKAQALAAKPPAALRQSKALLRGHMNEITARIGVENDGIAERLVTPEFKEAATAFFEKRAPDFSKFS
jgi:enoyl-CoA hydratase/carnithine racemase